MRGYIEPGESIPVIAVGTAIVSGTPRLLGSATTGRMVIPLGNAAVGSSVSCATEGVYELVAPSALVAAQGAILYWDDTAKAITLTAAANTELGWTWKAKANGELLIQLKLRG